MHMIAKMPTSGMENSGYSNIFQECLENLILVEKEMHLKLRDAEESTPESSGNTVIGDLEDFWREVDLISKKLSYECTKLCISFCSSPLPTSSETSALLQSVEQTILALISVIYKLNYAFGKTLHGEVVSCSVRAVQATRQLVRVIKEEEGEGISERYRHATGIAWEGCKQLEECPKNNKDAVLNKLRCQHTLISDALDEISEEMKGDGGGWDELGLGSDDAEEAKWSDKDKELMTPTFNLIKSSKMLFKRIIDALEKNGKYDDSEQIKELDQILEDARPLSETIDSLILELYPPLNVANMELQSQQLATHILSTLKTAIKSHVITEAEQVNIEFVRQAVDHNLQKMKELLRIL